MFSFFKKKKKVESNSNNEFLDIEASMYDTEAEANNFQDNVNYQNLVYSPPENEAPKYKAVRNNIGVVIDKDQFGYNINDFNSNIKTYELEKSTDEEKVEFKSEDLEVPKEIHKSIEELVVDNDNEQFEFEEATQSNVMNETIKKPEDEFSIFGSKSEIEKEKKYEATNYQEEPIELIKDVKMTKDGHKICPNCGTILKPDAPICFMCSKSFIKK